MNIDLTYNIFNIKSGLSNINKLIILNYPLPDLPPRGQEPRAFPPWGKRERG
jgi:hypothetical protein